MRKKLLVGIVMACALLASGRAGAEGEVRSGGPDISYLFQRGRIDINAGGGYGLYNNTSYLILALGGGYYVLDGLSLGLTGEAWVGSTPQIFDVSPAARYVFLDSPWTYKPFVGAFYRRTGYSNRYSPVDSVGARAGLVFPLTRQAYLTGDLAYEHYFACSSNINTQCDSVYPEVGLEFSF
jgi:hypothetical protein